MVNVGLFSERRDKWPAYSALAYTHLGILWLLRHQGKKQAQPQKDARITYWRLQILPGDRRPVSQDAPDLCPASILMLRVQSQAVEKPGDAGCRGVVPRPHEGVHLRSQVSIWEGFFIFSLQQAAEIDEWNVMISKLHRCLETPSKW